MRSNAARKVIRLALSVPEETLALQLRASNITFLREFKAVPERRWRFDFQIGMLLVEVQGGVWGAKKTAKNPEGKTGHNSGAGITRDCEKLNEVVARGYAVMHVTPAQVKSGQALAWIERWIARRNAA